MFVLYFVLDSAMKKLLFAPAVAAGLTALFTLPASAVSITGFDAGVELYGAGIFGPGNFELGETDGGLDGLQGSLSLDLGDGHELTLKSITQADWDGGLADDYFADAWAVYGATATSLFPGITQEMFKGAFLGDITVPGIPAIDWLARLSDPNIESVEKADNGDVHITLAGFLDLSPLLPGLSLPTSLYASEVVAYEYGDEMGYLYSFGEPEPGEFIAPDGQSFSGLYKVKIDGDKGGEAVPEPAAMAGLVAVGGWMLKKRLGAKGEATAPRFS